MILYGIARLPSRVAMLSSISNSQGQVIIPLPRSYCRYKSSKSPNKSAKDVFSQGKAAFVLTNHNWPAIV